jgi:hypothetical protein
MRKVLKSILVAILARIPTFGGRLAPTTARLAMRVTLGENWRGTVNPYLDPDYIKAVSKWAKEPVARNGGENDL